MTTKRATEYCHLPTERWLRTRNPQTKTEILVWYEREKKVLERRRLKSLKRKIEVISYEVDRETKEVVSKEKLPQISEVECWKLSEQDFVVYSRLLDQQFQIFKEAHNARVLKARENKSSNPAPP